MVTSTLPLESFSVNKDIMPSSLTPHDPDEVHLPPFYLPLFKDKICFSEWSKRMHIYFLFILSDQIVSHSLSRERVIENTSL